MLKISDETIEIIADGIVDLIRQGRLLKDTAEGGNGWQGKGNLEVLWYNYIKRVDPHEKRYVVIIKNLLTKQAKEVFDKIKRYPNDYKKWMFDKKKWLKEFTEAEAKFIVKLYKQEGQKAIDLALKLSRKSYYKAEEEIPISIAFDVYNPEVTDELIKQTTRFPAGVVGTSEEIIRREIANGLELGESIDKLRKRVTGRLGPTYIKNRAEMIARSETIYASNAGAELGYMQSGVVEGKKWLTALDERTCDPCTDMNNMTAPIGQPTWEKEGLNIGDVQGKYGLDFDYTEGAMPFPPLHPRCRCTITPIVKVISKKPWKPTMTPKEAEAWAKGSAFEKEVFYHGTSKEGAAQIGKEGFELKRLGLNRGNGGIHGAGHYVSTSKEYAGTYGEKLLKVKMNVRNALTDYKKFEKLEDIGYNLAEAAKGRYGTTIAQARRTITNKRLLGALDTINDKDWKAIHEMMSERFGLEHVQRYIYKKAGYDAVRLGDGVETVIFNEKSLVVIKPKPAVLKIPKWKPTMTRAEADLWAKGSVYADDVLYHGTLTKNANMIKKQGFKLENLGKTTGNGGFGGAGHYISPDYSYAGAFTGGKGEVLKIKLNIKNVLKGGSPIHHELYEQTFWSAQTYRSLGDVTLAEARKRALSATARLRLHQITVKQWNNIKAIMKKEKWGIEMCYNYMFKQARYDAVVFDREVIIFGDRSLVVIK